MARRRLDVELVRRGLVSSRTAAQEAVAAGLVTVGGRPATKPATLVASGEALHVAGEVRPFASRGGEKLEAALERFAVDVAGRKCLDAGASTGGFTDVLLRAGARHVVAVDVGYGQLAWDLRTDERVTVFERTNVRDLTPEALATAPELVVADLSFISLATAAPALVGLAADGATFVLLVKPQFEVGKEAVGRGGVVRDPAAWAAAIRRVVEVLGALGVGALGVMASPKRGPAGNVEFLLHARLGATRTIADDDVETALRDGDAIAG